MNRFMSLAVALVAILAITAPVAAVDQRPVVLEFLKSGANGEYAGTITSDGGGTLRMSLDPGSEVHGYTQHFTATVWVDDSAAGDLTAVVSGKIDFLTGKVFLNGTVTGGDYEGAQVKEESQLIAMDADGTLTFVGTVTILPAS